MIFAILSFLLVLIPFGVFSRKSGSFFSRSFDFKKVVSFLKPQNIVSSLLYLLSVFDFMFKNSFGVHFLWTTGFVSWVLGCVFWVLQVDAVSLTFVLASVGFGLLAILSTFGLRINRSVNLAKDNSRISVGALFVSISVVAMVSFRSFAAGLTTIVLLCTAFYCWKLLFAETKQEQVHSSGFSKPRVLIRLEQEVEKFLED